MTVLLEPQVEPRKVNRLERIVHELLLEQGVDFVVHPKIRVVLFGKRRRLTPDIYVPAENLVIEVNGCWVHACAQCGGGGHGSEEKRWRDEARLEAIRRAGYDVDVYWEHELVPNRANGLFAQQGRASRRRPGGHTNVSSGREAVISVLASLPD